LVRKQGLGGIGHTELLLLSRDPVLRARQEPNLTVDLDCITCTYKGGKAWGKLLGSASLCRCTQPGGTNTDVSLEKDARNDPPAL